MKVDLPVRLYLMIAVLTLVACSNKQMYESVQTNRLNACEKLIGSQREECIAQHSTPYTDYQRERETLREPE